MSFSSSPILVRVKSLSLCLRDYPRDTFQFDMYSPGRSSEEGPMMGSIDYVRPHPGILLMCLHRDSTGTQVLVPPVVPDPVVSTEDITKVEETSVSVGQRRCTLDLTFPGPVPPREKVDTTQSRIRGERPSWSLPVSDFSIKYRESTEPSPKGTTTRYHESWETSLVIWKSRKTERLRS